MRITAFYLWFINLSRCTYLDIYLYPKQHLLLIMETAYLISLAKLKIFFEFVFQISCFQTFAFVPTWNVPLS